MEITTLKIGTATPTAAELRKAEQEVTNAERDVRVTRQQLTELAAQKKHTVEIEAGITAPAEHPDELQKRLEKINGEIRELELKGWNLKDPKSETAFSISAGLTELRTRAALLTSSAANTRRPPILPIQAAAKKSEATRRLAKISDEIESLESRLKGFEQKVEEKQARLAATVKSRNAHPVYAEAQRLQEKDLVAASKVAERILKTSAELLAALDEAEQFINASDVELARHNSILVRLGLEQIAPDQRMRQFYFTQRDQAAAMLRAFPH